MKRGGFLKRRTPLRAKTQWRPVRKPMKRGRIKAKRGATPATYGLKLSYRRYKGLKGIYWHLLSEYVRRRDFKAFGRCISCNRIFTAWNEAQAGHYAPAGNCGFDLLFDPRNIHAECAACNSPTISPGKLIFYRMNLIARYGDDYVLDLDSRYRESKMGKTTKQWTQLEYDGHIRALQALIAKEHGISYHSNTEREEDSIRDTE
jgi:hypothetical protein